MVFSIMLRMCTEGIDAVGHVARLNYDKEEREIQRLAATIVIHQLGLADTLV
ncbi:hypothetical protein PVAP13_1KG557880 [Panicum virgatum]|uniref:Uncharacterized protein n=1 Tax=Panicum virgatum TaxID=38727 RepID=A0A8T0XUV3_PANVG|nr:hypothetical protein PVAP13_1KG557880 [Panicum virgatum]